MENYLHVAFTASWHSGSFVIFIGTKNVWGSLPCKSTDIDLNV
jgi:hypothetical protein